MQQADGAELAVGQSRLQRIHGAIGRALRLLRPGHQQRFHRIGQRIMRQLRKAEFGLLPLPVACRKRCQQQGGNGVVGHGAGKLSGLRRAGEQIEHESLVA